MLAWLAGDEINDTQDRLEDRVSSLNTHTGSQKQLTRSIFSDTTCSYILTVRLYNCLLAIVSESIGLVFLVVDSSLNNFILSEPGFWARQLFGLVARIEQDEQQICRIKGRIFACTKSRGSFYAIYEIFEVPVVFLKSILCG